MNQVEEREADKTARFTRSHKKRSIWTWIFPLAIILAIIIYLPKVLALLEG